MSWLFSLINSCDLHYHGSMNWQDLLDPEIQKFISDNKNADIKALALKKPPNPDWPYADIMNQIKAAQKAAQKFPNWQDKNLLWASADLVEQSSSYPCATFKASLVNGSTFADLTTGTGADTLAFAQNFKHGYAIEKDSVSAEVLDHNCKILNTTNIIVKNQSAEEFVRTMPDINLAYLDPQRRDGKRRGIYDLADCSPNIFDLLPDLKQKCKTVLIKTSPILDIKKTIHDLGNVKEVYIVQYDGDCKELLFLLDFQSDQGEPTITPLIINDQGAVTSKLQFHYSTEETVEIEYSKTEQFLYEPDPAFMKAGCFNTLANEYTLKKLHPHTHLYTSQNPLDNFPGRKFEVLDTCTVNKKSLKNILPTMKANLTIRNFPSHVDALSKKLSLKGGGDIFLFACINNKNEKILIKCRKN